MQDINEFKKLLTYFNNELSPSVALLTVVNISWAVSGVFWIFNYDHVDHKNIKSLGKAIVNVLLWISIAISPFIQASRIIIIKQQS